MISQIHLYDIKFVLFHFQKDRSPITGLSTGKRSQAFQRVNVSSSLPNVQIYVINRPLNEIALAVCLILNIT